MFKLWLVKSELIKISKVKSNPDNPRLIKDIKFKKLVNSIKEFPKMLELRPIVVNDDMIVLGGNMRLKACKEAGLKEVYVVKASELSAREQREFTIKDNVGFGEWDWDMLANEWGNKELNDWGLDVWQPDNDVSNNNDYSMNTADEKLNRFLDAKIKNITIPLESNEFENIVNKLELVMVKYKCKDYRGLLYKIIENAKV